MYLLRELTCLHPASHHLISSLTEACWVRISPQSIPFNAFVHKWTSLGLRWTEALIAGNRTASPQAWQSNNRGLNGTPRRSDIVITSFCSLLEAFRTVQNGLLYLLQDHKGFAPLLSAPRPLLNQPGEIPSLKLFENERIFAFMDIQPLSAGHSVR